MSSFDTCTLQLKLRTKLPLAEIRDVAKQYEADGMEPEAAMMRAVQDQLDMAKMQERQIVKTVREAYEAQGGKKRAPKAAPAPAEPAAEAAPLEAHEKAIDAARAGTATADQLRAGYQRAIAAEAEIKTALSAKKKDELLAAGGAMFAYRNKGEKKPYIVDALYADMLEEYTLGTTGGISYMMGGPGGGTYASAKRAAMDKAMAVLTDEKVKEFAAKVAEARAERAQQREQKAAALSDPQTLQDYQQLLQDKQDAGMTFPQARMTMTPEQRARFDEMLGAKNRENRAGRKTEEKKIRVAGQLVDAEIVATKHTQKGHDLFVVQLGERVSDEDYRSLLQGAKALGGYYSRYRGNGAVPGFTFADKGNAESFVRLANGDASEAQAAADARRDAFADDRSQTAVERLNEMADRLESMAAESEGRERKTNTNRRARFAAAADEQARRQRAFAETMRNIAVAIQLGEAKFLDQVRQKVQIELLGTLLANARYNAERDNKDATGRFEERIQRPFAVTDADHAEWPTYTAFRSDLATLGRQLSEIEGAKKLGQQILKMADDVSAAYQKFAKDNLMRVSAYAGADGQRAVFANKEAAERAIERSGFRGKAVAVQIKRGENVIVLSPSEAIQRGIWQGDGDAKITLPADLGAELVEKLGRLNRRTSRVEMPWQLETAHQRRAVLARMNIETPAEMRAALREFVNLKVAPKQADRVKELERSMVGRRADGLDFFPTPAGQADEMVAAADIQPEMTVLEPSAGMGHIADRIREAGVDPDVVEISGDRRELLEAKGYNLIGSDFLDVTLADTPDGAGYDRILMNPPFSDRRDAQHVQHAFSLLKPGGRLVAIVGEGVFFGKDGKAGAFRDWLDKHGGTSEKLEEGTFMDASLPVNTSVNARMIVVDRPADGVTLNDIDKDRRETPDRRKDGRTVESGGRRRPITNSKGQLVAADFRGQLAFWKWFADSRVVDDAGHPLVVYHGATDDFSQPNGWFWAADGADVASGYATERADYYEKQGKSAAPHVMPIYLSLQNPLVVDADGDRWHQIEWRDGYYNTDQIAKIAEEEGHDGVIFKNLVDGLDDDGYSDMARNTTYVAFKPEQIKSATGNAGTFDPESGDITHDLMAEPNDADLVQQAQDIMADHVGLSMPQFRAKIEAPSFKARPVRGADAVKAALAAGRADGSIPKDTADFALWALGKAPHLAEGLKLERGDMANGAVGSYRSAERVMTILKGQGNPGTAVHEILHHAERMMPADVQQGIAKAWFKAYMEAWNDADPQTRAALEDMLTAGSDRAAMDRTIQAFYDGVLDYDQHYQLTNASEYWAVNATRIMAERHAADSWVAKAKQWLAEFIEQVKGWLGQQSDAAVLDGLRAVLGGNGEFQSEKMLTQLPVANDLGDQTSSKAFRDWFGKSVVTEDGKPGGKPRVVYHGSPDMRFMEDDATFKSQRERLGFGRDEAAHWFAAAPSTAKSYADPRRAFDYQNSEPGVIPAFLKMENPLIVDGHGQKWRDAQKSGKTTDVIREASEGGHDGVIIRNVRDNYQTGVVKGDVATDTYVVFSSNQIKSADRNNGQFDPANPSILHDIPRNPQQSLESGIRSSVLAELPHKISNRLKDFRGVGLQALGRRQLVDIYADDFKPDGKESILARYSRLMQQMDADKNEAGAEADGIADRWGKLADADKLADLMHDSTLAQIDPDKDYVAGDNRAQWAALKARMRELSPEAQAIYREARDAYSAHWNKVRAEIRSRITRAIPESPRRAQLLEKMDATFYEKVKGVYFPLARFGDYVVTVSNANGERLSVNFAETMNEAEALRRALVAKFPPSQGHVVSKITKKKEFNAGRDSVSRGFMQELFGVLDQYEGSAELQDDINQLYLSSLPDLSWAKHGIHRKGTPGFSQDARRAFAQNMFHGARYLAKLRYGDRLADHLMEMQDHVDSKAQDAAYDSVAAQQVVDEMNKRHELYMNPKNNPLSSMLTSLGFVFYLGLSPASAAVNLSQTPLVTLPMLAAKYGFGKASAALLEASKQAASNRNDISKALTGDELKAFTEAVNAGVIDVSMAHDLAGIASGDDTKAHANMRPVMKWASWMFHHGEKFNRQATLMAAYRLARDAGQDHAAAYESAVNEVYASHFDYSTGNRARVMQGNVARVVLLFKQYGQNMIYTLTRNALLAAKGDRTAQKTIAGLLLSHSMAAGVLGLPLVGTLLAAASAIGGDDDDPWDAKVALRNMLADLIGQKPAEVMMHGMSRLTPFDISGRVGLDKLILPDVQEGLEGARAAESWMTAALGPVAGIGLSAAKGLDTIAHGDYLRGLESLMPVALRNPIKALRYGTEGVKDVTGIPIVQDTSEIEELGQLLGFSPSRVRETMEGKGAAYQAEHKLNNRHRALVEQWANARMAGDIEGQQDIKAAIDRFNEKNPTRRITMATLTQSLRARTKRIEQAQDGIYLPKKHRDVAELGRFAEQD